MLYCPKETLKTNVSETIYVASGTGTGQHITSEEQDCDNVTNAPPPPHLLPEEVPPEDESSPASSSPTPSTSSPSETTRIQSHGGNNTDQGRERSRSCRERLPEGSNGYELLAHITYSHEATSPSNASGMRTPCLSVETILSQMEEDLAALWESGQEVTVNMLAQEISRLAQDHEPPSTTHNIFRVLAGISQAYLAPGMELGIALAPRWTQWLNSLESNVRRTAHALDDLPSGTEDEEEGAIFMGHPSKKGSNKKVRDGSDRRRRRTRTTSTSLAPWTTAPWRKDRAEPDRRDSRRGHEPTSSSTPSTTANAARSANRMTWRTLLAMNDSGPCLNMSAHIPSALDEDQSNNIQATLENMTLEERMTLLSGFSCFMQELCVEVMTLFVVRAHEDAQMGTNATQAGTDAGREDEDEEPDNMMTMQLSTTSLDLARTMFGNVQTSLDKMKLQGMSPSLLEEAQSLVAVLIVLSHENPPDAEETYDDQDNAWVNAWTQHLRGMVQQIAQREGQSASSTGVGTVMVESQDTPSTDALVAGGGHDITADE